MHHQQPHRLHNRLIHNQPNRIRPTRIHPIRMLALPHSSELVRTSTHTVYNSGGDDDPPL